MMLSLIGPVAFVASVVLFLVRARNQSRRRSSQTWGDLVSRLEPGWNPVQLCECLASQNSSPEERWEQLHGARGLYVMFQNAKVMLEMADYAARNSATIDRSLLAELRSDALQIRVSVVLALTQYALHQLNESICANALRAASLYKDMNSRMSDLLQVNGQMAAQCAGAM